jgi:hypothetical protein
LVLLVDVADERVASFIDVDVLDADEVWAAMAKAPKGFHLGDIGL